jgi:hypothetical protein
MDQLVYNISIDETIAVNTTILNITAIDNDRSDANHNITFSLRGIDDRLLFAIDRHTGALIYVRQRSPNGEWLNFDLVVPIYYNIRNCRYGYYG